MDRKKLKARSRRALLVALLLAVVAAGGTFYYIQTREQQFSEQLASIPKPPPRVPVVTAKVDLPARTVLRSEMLTLEEVPEEVKHELAVSSPEEAEGKSLAVPVTAGEQILTSKFRPTTPARETFANTVPPGMRAVSVVFKEEIGSGGLILPGDRVDVIAAFDRGTMGKDQALYVIQNVEVLAVGQTVQADAEAVALPTPQRSPGEVQPGLPAAPARAADDATGGGTRAGEGAKARSVTLSVTPEQAQRLVLAEETGKLRLALRSQGDATLVDLPEATLGSIRGTAEAGDAIITSVSISPSNVAVGDVITVRITVKNTSNLPISSQGPDPTYTYQQDQTFHSAGFPSESGRVRVGVSFADTPLPFPYRWGFGGELAPGATATIVGQIKVTRDFKPTSFWAGLIREPSTTLQDNQGLTTVAALPVNAAVVNVDSADVRAAPSLDSALVDKVEFGAELPIVDQQKGWYKIRLKDGRLGWLPATWIVAPGGTAE